jgi:hypothetical protein
MTGDAHEPAEATNRAVAPSDESGEFHEVSELLHADAGSVQADSVHIEQSSARSIAATDVVIDQSAIKDVTTQSATVSQSASLLLKGSDVAFHESVVGYASADRVDLIDSTVGILKGPVSVSEGSSRVLVHIGPADGAIKPVLDAQSAVALGAGFGATLVILSRLLRRLLGN